MTSRQRWRLGRIIPVIIIVTFTLDLAARFIPLDRVSFRGWEALARYHGPCGPFRANAYYDNPLSYGDLASMGNLPQYRQYRQEIFSTDGFGFRRNSHVLAPSSAYGAILVGDSMVVGSGVSDDETLPAKLGQRLGVEVYNGAGWEQPDLDRILALARRLNMSSGTVIYGYTERTSLPRERDLVPKTRAVEIGGYCDSRRARISILYEGFVQVSVLQILAQLAFKTLQNDRVLPNIFKSKVVSRTLMNGEPILFYPLDVRRSLERERSLDVSGFRRLAEELNKHNLRLVLLLLPGKYTVYEPLLKGHGSRGDQRVYLELVEKALEADHIPVINLVNVFWKRAREYYEENLYIYWRDDTHWNAQGIELAAEEMSRENVIASIAGGSRRVQVE